VRNSVTTITDDEFGPISVRRFDSSRHIRIKIDSHGKVSATMPRNAALRHVHELLDMSRVSLRKSLQQIRSKTEVFTDRQRIGSSHSILVETGDGPSVRLRSPYIVVTLENPGDIEQAPIQRMIRDIVVKTLRAEAKAYLPRRLRYIADQNGFNFSSIRFSNASTRWGSCSSSGTISLNVWLMQLDHELIDYVLIHELCHTRQMNHSEEFWNLVAMIDPEYKAHRRALKDKNPYI